jgi:hypothetical protein
MIRQDAHLAERTREHDAGDVIGERFAFGGNDFEEH